MKRNNRKGGAAAGAVRPPLELEGTGRASWRRWLASVVSCRGSAVTGREGNGRQQEWLRLGRGRMKKYQPGKGAAPIEGEEKKFKR